MARVYTTDGDGVGTNTNFMLEASKGNIEGHTVVGKFGKAFDIDSADGFCVIWDGCGNANSDNTTYTYSTTAAIDSLSSSDNGDTMAITVIGLDSDWAEVAQTITLTGQTRVALTTNLLRVYRMYVDDSTTSPSGDIFCFENVATTAGVPNTGSLIRAIITQGYDQSLMAIYTIPAGKTGYLIDFYSDMISKVAGGAEVHLCARLEGKTMRVRAVQGINTTGTSFGEHNFMGDMVLPEKTDIHIQADVSANDSSVGAGFDIILVDN